MLLIYLKICHVCKNVVDTLNISRLDYIADCDIVLYRVVSSFAVYNVLPADILPCKYTTLQGTVHHALGVRMAQKQPVTQRISEWRRNSQRLNESHAEWLRNILRLNEAQNGSLTYHMCIS